MLTSSITLTTPPPEGLQKDVEGFRVDLVLEYLTFPALGL